MIPTSGFEPRVRIAMVGRSGYRRDGLCAWRPGAMTTVRLHMAGYADSDAEEQAELASRLSEELRDLDAADVSRPETTAPGGAKGSGVEWAQLVVELAGTLPALVTVVGSWLGRHPGTSITVEIDGDALTLNDATASERRELIDMWISRHGG
jgi:hypothetical protein